VNKDHPGQVKDGDYDGHHTLWEAYSKTAKKFPNNQHLGTRNKVLEDGRRVYDWKTYGEVFEIQNSLARGK